MTEGKVYLKNKIEAMNNDERILFIYFKLVESLRQAKAAVRINDIEDRVLKINKGVEIITTLLSILDMDEGKEIAVRLKSIYTYSIDRLSVANIENDENILSEMILIYSDLHGTWQKKIVQDRKEAMGQPQPAAKTISSKPVNEEQSAYSETKSGLELYG